MELLRLFIEKENLKGYRKKTIQKKKREIEKFISSLKTSLLSVTGKDIESYLEEFKTTKSYNRKLSYLNQFFEFLLDRDEVLFNPAVNIERIKHIKSKHYGMFTEDEIKSMIDSTSQSLTGKRDRAVIELFYSTGLRISELVNLDLDDVDCKNREIFVINGKLYKERVVPIGIEALKTLKKYLRIRHRFPCTDYESLFLSTRGNRLSVSGARKIIERMKKNVGIESKGTAHALRHSCASHMLENGAPLPMIQKMLGHNELSSTQMYTHVRDEDLAVKYRTSRNENNE